jgi:hypothetical protein
MALQHDIDRYAEEPKPRTADMLGQLLAENIRTSTGAPPTSRSPLDALRLPSVGIKDYARILEQHFLCSRECYVLSFVYIERALQLNPGLAITDLNVHRLLLAATLVAVKVQDDFHASKMYYAKGGGVTTKELNSLEVYMLTLLGWRTYVSEEEYNSSLKWLNDGHVSLRHPVHKIESSSEPSQSFDEASKAIVCDDSTPREESKEASDVQVMVERAARGRAKRSIAQAKAEKVLANRNLIRGCKRPAILNSCPSRKRIRLAVQCAEHVGVSF